MNPQITNFLKEKDLSVLEADGANPALEADLDEAGINTDDRENDLVVELPGHFALCVRSATKLKEGGTMTPEQLASVRELLYVVRTGVGVDNLDIAALAELGIIVMNTPKATTESVGEHTLTLTLHLLKRLSISDRLLGREFSEAELEAEWLAKKNLLENMGAEGAAIERIIGKWEDVRQKARGFKKEKTEEMKGKDVLVIGSGNIGRDAAAKMNALKANVTFYDPFAKVRYFVPHDSEGKYMIPTDQEMPTALPVVQDRAELQQLIQKADIITIHVPDQDEPIIGEAELQLIAESGKKPYIVNTSRPTAIDTLAVLDALEQGNLRGVGLDVFDEEKAKFADSEGGRKFAALKQKELNLVGSGHSAGNSKEGQENTGHEAAEYIAGLREGKVNGFGVRIDSEIPEGHIRLVAVIHNVSGAIAKITGAFEADELNIENVDVNKANPFGGENPTDIVAFDIRNGGDGPIEISERVETALTGMSDSPIVRAMISGKAA